MWSTFASTEIPLFVDRCHNLVLASTEIPVFMNKIAKLTVVSTQTALFVDSPRFRWREYGQQATRLANMPTSRSKQAARATPKGSLLMLCALSPTSRPYLSLGLSIRATLFVDRCHNLVLASTEIPVFMDKIAQLTILSTRTALFMDSPQFRWREYGRQATRLASTPASRSKQAARATPKGSLRCFVPRAKSPHTLSFVASCPSSPHSSGQKLQDGVSAA